jgi:hypothetical protein
LPFARQDREAAQRTIEITINAVSFSETAEASPCRALRYEILSQSLRQPNDLCVNFMSRRDLKRIYLVGVGMISEDRPVVAAAEARNSSKRHLLQSERLVYSGTIRVEDPAHTNSGIVGDDSQREQIQEPCEDLKLPASPV